MWDEKKFFDDYISETDNIKPDSEFVKGLKESAENEAGSDKRFALPKYGIAIAAVLCIFAGAALWGINGGIYKADNNVKKPGSYAGKDGQVQSGEVKIITLKAIKECLNAKESVITDKDGREVSEEKKEDLSDLINCAVSTDYKPTGEEEYDTYKCSGQTKFSLKVYDSGYIVIEETGMVYKVVMV